MAIPMDSLLTDLAAETIGFEAMIATLPDVQWQHSTPADGWTIADQVSHLAYFDDMATLAATDPQAFVASRAEAIADVDGFTARIAAANRARTPQDLLAWFRSARSRLVGAFAVADPSLRLPWYGPDMSATSAITARIMETWAHGQDVADALGVEHAPTAAIQHVAYLGVRTRGFSFAQRGLEPGADVLVELSGPMGEQWSWGPNDALDVVRGEAVEFCLVVTQRVNIADTDLVVHGPGATQWMQIAQAFAGPPGPGRSPSNPKYPSNPK